jgi:tetratricopeptide (TPR) repeat protein/tRNA A-37 threonylcarbamoyl transferase component Bud32
MADPLSRLKAALSSRYTIERELGSGGMATVYLAEDLKLHRKVALKVLRPELASALGPDRFLQEIDIAAKLTHPHILGLHDCGEADGYLYYVMPYVEGQSLRDKLAKEGELPIAETVRILRDVVDALSHAHKHNVVHRDIKPDNVMLTERHALVTDFGVAKAVSEATGRQKLTTEGVALGTPAYMSPEQASADPHIDHRADIYAVGVIAYELLTGRTPFVGNTQQELLAAHVTQTPEPVTKYRESVPPALAELVMKCLEKKAADRWQTAEELLPQLEALATPSGGVTPTGLVPVDRRVKRRWMMAGGAVAVAAIIAVIVVMAALPRGSKVVLDPNHVTVAVFRNATGDPSLDQVGELAAHSITQGLQQAAIQVSPWDMALQSWQYVQSEGEAGRVRDPIRAVAEETCAGTVISGAVYLQNDSLEIRVNVTDVVRGEPLGAVDPARGPQASARDVIADAQQRVMGFLAINFDERISDQASSVVQPPSFEAYREFDQGLELYMRSGLGLHMRSGNDRNAIPHFYRAFELDTTFVTPLIYATLTHNNNRQWAQSDSLVGILGQYRAKLSEYDRHWLDYLKARVDGDIEEALRAIRRAAEVAPGSKAVYNRALMANGDNRPQEALDALLTLDPERGPMRGWPGYWTVQLDALQMLGEHEEALEAIRRGCELYGGVGASEDTRFSCLVIPSTSLAALGRSEEAIAMFADLDAFSIGVARYAAQSLLGYGHVDAARQLLSRIISWLEDRPEEEKRTADHHAVYGWALFDYGRIDEAQMVFESLVDDDASKVTYRGVRGFFAAIAGDSAQARTDAGWLATLDRPYLYGGNTYWRAAIAGALGERDEAVNLLRQAFSEGFQHNWTMLWRSELSPLRDYPPFQEWLRPKG